MWLPHSLRTLVEVHKEWSMYPHLKSKKIWPSCWYFSIHTTFVKPHFANNSQQNSKTVFKTDYNVCLSGSLLSTTCNIYLLQTWEAFVYLTMFILTNFLGFNNWNLLSYSGMHLGKIQLPKVLFFFRFINISFSNHIFVFCGRKSDFI